MFHACSNLQKMTVESGTSKKKLLKIIIDFPSHHSFALCLGKYNDSSRCIEQPPNAHATSVTLTARHTHSHARTLTCFSFFPMDFRGKERLLAATFDHMMLVDRQSFAVNLVNSFSHTSHT